MCSAKLSSLLSLLQHIFSAVKTLVLEALTMVAPQTLAMCVVQVQRDTDLGFNFKLFNGEYIRKTG